MINFIDEYGKQHAAIVECQKTKGVNGEKSLSGTIYTNDEILEGIGRGWRLQFEDENYCLTYVNPLDEGNRIVVEFDAVHEFFFDLRKSVIYSEMNGSNTANAYLQFIFNGSGYEYRLEVTIPAFEKESFGMKNRLDLFKDFISSTGVEFSVNGKIVRILEKVGTNLSTVVKKGFNLNELRIEKDPGSFITYLRGYGAFVDPDDESKGRLIVEYLSPLTEVFGKLEGDPVIDERYTVANNLIERLKSDVENSYGISVDIDMEDLTRAGYDYDQPHEGDYIMAINKDLGFEQKIRIMSYTTSYDTEGNIIDHDVSCGSDNIIQKKINQENEYRKEVQAGLENAISTANQAWISADGKNKVFQGPDRPTATNKGDIWYQVDGEQTIMNYWNGFDWVPFINPDAVKESVEQAKQAGENAQEAADQAKADAQSAQAKADKIQIDVNGLVSDLTTISGTVNSISSKANEAYNKANAVEGRTATLETSVTGLTGRITDVESTATSTTKKLNELVVTVDGQKQTIATVTTTANSALSKANVLESTVDGVKQTLTSVEEWQDNFNVGGRNYFLNSDEEATSPAATSSEFLNRQTWDMAPIIDKFGVDQYYTISFELKSKIAGPVNVYSQNGSGTRYNIGTKTIQATTEFVRYSYTFKPKLQSSTETRALLAFYGTYNTGRTPTVRNLKFEVGNIPTDWSPAPEDKAESSKVNQIESTVNGTIQTVASVKNTADSALSKATQVETTANGLKTTVSSVETTANSALTKATQVETTANGLTSTVSSLQSDLNNLDIVGINYYKKSTTITSKIGNINIIKDYQDATNGFYFVGVSGNTGSFRIANVINSNGYWTVSFWMRGSQNSGVSVTVDICDLGATKLTTTSDNSWEFFSVTVDVTNHVNSPQTYHFVDFDNIQWAYFFVKDFKVEKGKNATSWTPATEDIATSSQITQLSDTINFKVSKNDVINQINISTDGVLIAGNKVQITGQTYIEDGVIGRAQIANLAVSTAQIADAAITDAKIGSLSATKITTGTLNAANVNIINLNANSITTGTISGTNLSINLATGEVIFNKGIIKNLDDTFQMNITTGVTASRGEYLSPNDTGNTLAAGYNLMNGKIEFYAGTFGEATVSYGGLTTETHSGQYKENGIWQAGIWSGSLPAISLRMANPDVNVWQSRNRAVLLSSSDYQEPYTLNNLWSPSWLGYGDVSGAATKQNIVGGGIGVAQRGSYLDEAKMPKTEAWMIARHGVFLGSGYNYESTVNGGRKLTPSLVLGRNVIVSGSTDYEKQIAATSTLTAGYAVELLAKNILLWVGSTGDLRVQGMRTASGSANLVMDGSGNIKKVSSARKYKTAIEHLDTIDQKAKRILEIRPAKWVDKEALKNYNDDSNYYGFIADEFHELGLTEVVQYNDKGEVESLAYDRLSIYIIPLIQSLKNEVDQLKNKLKELEAA